MIHDLTSFFITGRLSLLCSSDATITAQGVIMLVRLYDCLFVLF